jgi:hypothetical protein
VKKFFIGFIVGAMLFSSIGVLAEGLTVLLNPYPIVINGEVANVSAYNIDGSTYLKLADLGKSLGIPVSFNSELKQIEITTKITNESEVKSMSIENPVIPDTITQTPDGITQIDTFEGKQYIAILNIRNHIKDKGYSVERVNDGSFRLVKGERVLLSNIPTAIVYGASEVETDYYINTILPLME